MTTTASVSSLQQDTQTAGLTSTLGNEEVSQQKFLELLVAQLQHQDPLNPTENQEFVAELATFSSLEQQQMQTQLLQKLISAQSATNTSQALSLIGKDVVVAEDSFQYEPGDTLDFSFQSAKSGTATVEITTDSGTVVDRRQIAMNTGMNEFTYDGVMGDNIYLAPGTYNMNISSSIDENGDSDQFQPYMKGEVESVSFLDGQPILTVNGQAIDLSYVQAVLANQNN